MKKSTVSILLIVLLTTLTGCAAMPEVKVSYYHPAASLGLVVTQTAMCTAGDIPVLVTDVAPAVSYSADRMKYHSIDISTLGSFVGKADGGFEFYSDGRLKSVNAKGTGQAGEVLKAFAKFAAAFALVNTSRPADAACKKLRMIVGDGKPLTVVHRGATDFPKPNGSMDFRQMTLASADFTSLAPIFGTLAVSYVTAPPAIDGTHSGKAAQGDQALKLIEPGAALVTVALTRGTDKAEWPLTVPVPQHGQEFELPIQKAPWFGTNEFELQLHESGKVTKLRYAGAADAAGVLGALTEARASLNGSEISAIDQAKQVQAQADLIFQQQRLVLCQANAATCTK